MLLRAHLNRRFSINIPLETNILGVEVGSSRWQQFGQSIYPRVGDEAGVIRAYGGDIDINGLGVRLIAGTSEYNSEASIINSNRRTRTLYYSGIARVYEYNRGNWIKLGNDILGDEKSQSLGGSVAMNDYGNVIAVGSPDDNLNGRVYSGWPNVIWQKLSNYAVDPGSEYGSVKVFTYIPSITSSWIQLGKMIRGERENSNPYASRQANGRPIGTDYMADHLGLTLKMNMSGNRIAIGYSKGIRVYELEPLSASSLTSVTSATSIELLGSYNWYKLGPDIITGTDHGDRSLDINASGDSIIVGQIYTIPYKARTGKTDPGAAKVYKYNSSLQTWSQVGSDLKVPGTENMAHANNGMGVSMSQDGRIVAVGAPTASLANGQLKKVGLVQVFSLSGSNKWVTLGSTISGYNNIPGSYFGFSVSLNAAGNVLAISSPGVDIDGNALVDDKPKALVQIFIWNGTSWQQVGNNIDQSQSSTGSKARDKYGYWYNMGYGQSILLSNNGDKVFIGAPGYENVRDAEKIKPSGLVETYNIVKK